MRPAELPAVRDALRRFAASSYAAANARENLEVEHLVRSLRAAELFWVAEPMAELARDVAARDIRETRWLHEDRPAGCGLMFVDGRPGCAALRR